MGDGRTDSLVLYDDRSMEDAQRFCGERRRAVLVSWYASTLVSVRRRACLTAVCKSFHRWRRNAAKTTVSSTTLDEVLLIARATEVPADAGADVLRRRLDIARSTALELARSLSSSSSSSSGEEVPTEAVVLLREREEEEAPVATPVVDDDESLGFDDDDALVSRCFRAAPQIARSPHVTANADLVRRHLARHDGSRPDDDDDSGGMRRWQVLEASDGSAYYYDTINDVATWAEPDDLDEVVRPNDALAAAELPPDYEECVDDQGRTFYYHVPTDTATWERPSASRGTDLSTAAEAPAADQWECHKDEQSGSTFYYNCRTGVSQWEPPSDPAAFISYDGAPPPP